MLRLKKVCSKVFNKEHMQLLCADNTYTKVVYKAKLSRKTNCIKNSNGLFMHNIIY